MDIVNAILFWMHLVALAVGGAAVFGIPIAGSLMPGAAPEARPLLDQVIERLSRAGRGAIGVLVITGPLLVWLKYGGFSDFTIWFWIKMILVVAMVAGVIYVGVLMRRGAAGDSAEQRRQPGIGAGLLVVYLCIILSAVLAFG